MNLINYPTNEGNSPTRTLTVNYEHPLIQPFIMRLCF